MIRINKSFLFSGLVLLLTSGCAKQFREIRSTNNSRSDSRLIDRERDNEDDNEFRRQLEAALLQQNLVGGINAGAGLNGLGAAFGGLGDIGNVNQLQNPFGQIGGIPGQGLFDQGGLGLGGFGQGQGPFDPSGQGAIPAGGLGGQVQPQVDPNGAGTPAAAGGGNQVAAERLRAIVDTSTHGGGEEGPIQRRTAGE